MKCPHCDADNLEDSRFCRSCGETLKDAKDIDSSLTKTIRTPATGYDKGSIFAGRYHIIEKLGEGGMGVVYKAKDVRLKRTVALKFLPPELTKEAESRERFVREAQSAAALAHPNICTIHEIEEDDEKSFIVMEYVEGQSLKEKIKAGSVELEDVLDIAIQAAEGLEAAHKKGIVHRDIKSGNIMITNEGQTKIMDFGLAKVAGESLITKEARTMGTAAYMSPEQARGEPVDHRTDIWSLGVVLYEMLSGQLPFKGERETSMMYSIVHEEPKSLKALKPDISDELVNIISRTLEKKPDSRYSSADDFKKDLVSYQSILHGYTVKELGLKSFLRIIRKPQLAIPVILLVVVLAFFTIKFLNNRSKVLWAKESALPEISNLIESDNYIDAYFKAAEVKKYIPRSSELEELRAQMTGNVFILTTPKEADIYFGKFENSHEELRYLGKSPIENAPIPLGFLRIKVLKDHYRSVETVIYNSRPYSEKALPIKLGITLDEDEKIPEEMVRIPAKDLRLALSGYDTPEVISSSSYLIDKFEITNRQYKEFIDNGGYENPEFWKEEFKKDGKKISWKEAVVLFRDQTGRPGPSTWEGGIYPEGQEDYPVSGISWFEAAAFAEYAGKSLPTIYHWLGATNTYIASILISHGNFNSEGPQKVGSYPSGPDGVYDMAGSVREWCWNKSGDLNYILGGSWTDMGYQFHEVGAVSPFDRSPSNGFRCVHYFQENALLDQAKNPIDIPQIDWKVEKSVSDDIFQIYKNMYTYDPKPLNEKRISYDDSHNHWIRELIEIDCVYGDERLMLHLFLPKNIEPPYQAVIFFPGMGALLTDSSENLLYTDLFDFIVKSGRAFIYPVYQGTYERYLGFNTSNSRATREYSNLVIQLVNDVSRTIEYIETRSELIKDKIGFYGFSWGGRMGSIVMAIEDTIRAGILLVGGFSTNPAFPEVKEINYAPHVKVPVLMINGKHDVIFPLETSVRPMFDSLGTQNNDKQLILFDTGHNLFSTHRNTYLNYMLEWLDKYLGPVEGK